MIERRRLLLMRHGAVDYFDAAGRPYPPDDVPLTSAGIEQARAMGAVMAGAGLAVDRAITSGLARTRETAQHVLEAMGLTPPLEHWPDLREIQPGHLPSISDHELR
ncbi:MAG TPA: phosphoglycerate mutase family protein, partial [Burkholderiaceae bacterium]|nr:phosphoglycerate mutase family protein [Burkholderiaceae bacterium]